MTIQDFFTEYPKVAVAFSGGVDSAYLLYAAKKYAKEVKAYYVCTAFQPEFEKNDAKRFAKEFEIDMTIIEKDILSSKEVVKNPPDRCYLCKKILFSAILETAKKDGFPVLLDGTNASDDSADRPGMKALCELQVLSPLRICGLKKDRIRSLSRQAGLFTWNKPSYACLATRIATGKEITKSDLEKTERAEAYLGALGFSDFRVRLLGDSAKIQVTENQLELLVQKRNEILKELKQHYKSVLLDLEVRNVID